MPESPSLTAIRREQRRVAALIDASKQLGLALPSRQGGIPFEDLYKSSYYQQLQAGFKQMYIERMQQTAMSLPEMENVVNRQGNDANNDWMHDNVTKPAAVMSLGSTKEGWKHFREVKEKRDSFSKRNQFKTKRNDGGKRLFEASEGGTGQATGEVWTRKKIKSDRQMNDLISQKMMDKSGRLESVSLFDRLPNNGSNVDFRLPRLANTSGNVGLNYGGPLVEPDQPDQNDHHSSVTGKPLLRYNHGNKGRGMDLSLKGRPEESTRRNEAETSHNRSIYSDSPDDTYRPFYPQTPSVSPASLDSVDGLCGAGMDNGLGSNNPQFDAQCDPSLVYTRDEEKGSGTCLNSSIHQDMKHARWRGDFNANSDSADSAMKPRKYSPHSILNRSRNKRTSRESQNLETSMDPYRDAYVRALAVARSRRLPNDFTALGTRTTRAFSFSYFTKHKPTCKCQKCLERVLNDPSMKKPAKKRQQPQGLKLILGDVKMEDYYK